MLVEINGHEGVFDFSKQIPVRVNLWICIWEVSDLNVGCNTGHADWGVSWVHSFPWSSCWELTQLDLIDITENSNLSFTNQQQIRRYRTSETDGASKQNINLLVFIL